MQKLFITTPIYYASGKPHIGHAYTTILADVIARYKKSIGYDVFFLTGTDEHGQKILDSANKNNAQLKPFLDGIVDQFKNLWKDLDIDYSKFIRTTDKHHEKVVQEVFTKLLKNKDIYEGVWKGLYCVNCEENYSLDQAIKKDGKLYCKVGHELTTKNEPSYFLKVNTFSKWIKTQLTKKNFILPKARVNELLGSFIDKGLEDLSVTRTSLDWGIKTQENPKHVIYVWIDALLSYLSGLGYLSDNNKEFKKYWADKNSQVIHLMSKEIIRFHCIYWPILLKMLNLRLPTQIISHGWVVTKEGKMSKSLGNVIDPYDYIKAYGSDAFRYVITRQVSLEKDGIFSHDLFIETFNNELANNYGNMATRISGMIKKYFNNTVPALDEKSLRSIDKKVISSFQKFAKEIIKIIESLDINNLLDKIQEQYNVLNKYIEDVKPWELAKNPKHRKILGNCLNIIFNNTCGLATLLKPILVKTSSVLERAWKIKLDSKIFGFNWQGHKIGDLAPLFARITK